MTELENSLSYSIKRVKDTSFTINEHLYIDDTDKILRIDFAHALGVSADKRYINFTIIVIYKYDNFPLEEKLVELKVENVFDFNDLSKYIDGNGTIVLPFNVLVSLVGLCISHARALLAKNLAGTIFQEIILPIVNPTELTKHFFRERASAPTQEDINFNEANKA